MNVIGIDVYLKWDGMTESESAAQLTGFDVTVGEVGYLREAYHGEPYATKILFPETWDENWVYDTKPAPRPCVTGLVTVRQFYDPRYDEASPIVCYPADELELRLEPAVAAAMERSRVVYKEAIGLDHPVVLSFINFVRLYRVLFDEGKRPGIYNSF